MAREPALIDIVEHRAAERDWFYCPLCGFLMMLDLDGHFVPCLVSKIVDVEFRPALD